MRSGSTLSLFVLLLYDTAHEITAQVEQTAVLSSLFIISCDENNAENVTGVVLFLPVNHLLLLPNRPVI